MKPDNSNLDLIQRQVREAFFLAKQMTTLYAPQKSFTKTLLRKVWNSFFGTLLLCLRSIRWFSASSAAKHLSQKVFP